MITKLSLLLIKDGNFLRAGVELNEIQVSEDVEKNSAQFGNLILESIMGYNPDIIITESYIGKYNLFTDSKFAHLLLSQLHCPIIIVRDYYYAIGQFCDTSHDEDNWKSRSCSSCAFNEKQGKISFNNKS